VFTNVRCVRPVAGGSAAELDGRNFAAESTKPGVRHAVNLWSYFYKVKRVIALASRRLHPRAYALDGLR
jgi:hypothetical protein